MVKLGLDVGEKRIGAAISDANETVAFPLLTIERNVNELEEIRKIIETHHANEIVVGLPLSLQGKNTIQTEKVREFAEKLKKSLQVPVKLWDERLTTKQVQRFLKELPLSKKSEKSLRDRLSACLILQSYLDYLRENK
jgi:putative Holliday junction resolvase